MWLVEGVALSSQLSAISFQLSKISKVNLSVYDMTGRVVGMLMDEVKEKGEQIVKYDASGLRRGVYFVRIVSEEGVGESKFVKE